MTSPDESTESEPEQPIADAPAVHDAFPSRADRLELLETRVEPTDRAAWLSQLLDAEDAQLQGDNRTANRLLRGLRKEAISPALRRETAFIQDQIQVDRTTAVIGLVCATLLLVVWILAVRAEG
ncbi:MAG: hypothetical protein KC561_06755 [Myxococcales bacterium]|nr:hypothetical protein [Myxococcales bacterium]